MVVIDDRSRPVLTVVGTESAGLAGITGARSPGTPNQHASLGVLHESWCADLEFRGGVRRHHAPQPSHWPRLLERGGSRGMARGQGRRDDIAAACERIRHELSAVSWGALLNDITDVISLTKAFDNIHNNFISMSRSKQWDLEAKLLLGTVQPS